MSDHGHDHGGGADHGHSHGHVHDSWGELRGDSTLRIVTATIATIAVLTVVALVWLWPTAEGRDRAIERGAEFGLVTDRLTGTVETVLDGPCSYSTPDDEQVCRQIEVLLSSGDESGSLIALPEFNLTFDQAAPRVSVGDDIIVGFEPTTNFYFYADQDRRSPLLVLAIVFVVVVLALGRLRGVLALLSMATTIVLLVVFVAPSVLDGNDPLLVSVVAASAIAIVTLYLSHGWVPTTTISLAGTLSALLLTLGLSWVFFELSRFTGLATEEALTIPFIAGDIDMAALILGGAVLGALGALDDVTVTQVATVAEVHRRAPHLGVRELMASGISVGREHIAATVNTLLLAYVGASLPILLLFAISDQSLVMIANSELVAVEIVRTLCGSIGLVAAVPITTFLAAVVAARSGGGGTADTPVETAAPESTEPPTAAEPGRPRSADEPSWDDFSPDDDATWR